MNYEEKVETGNGIKQKDLVTVLTDYEHIQELEDTFDTDKNILDDNLNQGMKISPRGKPLE